MWQEQADEFLKYHHANVKDNIWRSSQGRHDVTGEEDGSQIGRSANICFKDCIHYSVGLGSCYCSSMIRRAEITNILI